MKNGGSYEGRSVVELLDDGRRVRLSEPYAYIDPAGLRWDVPAKAVVDGASIPRLLWSVIGGPFEGKYRSASIIHDWFCDVRVRPWQAVHRMFFEAMITSAVSRVTANLMYAGVYAGGPRWSETVVENSNQAFPPVKTNGGPGNGMAYIGLPTTGAFNIGGPTHGASGRPGHKRTGAKAVTIDAKRLKPRSYRPTLTQADFDLLRTQIGGKKMGVEEIEDLVDNRKRTTRR